MMLRIATIARWVIRLTGISQVVLGLLFWSHRALELLRLHMVIGSAFVLALWTLAGLGARFGSSRALPLLTVGLGLLIPTFGIVQVRLLPGSAHWVVQVAHLLLGVAGMVVAARLDRRVRLQSAADRWRRQTDSESPPASRAA